MAFTDRIDGPYLVDEIEIFTEGNMKTLKELQREIRQTIRQLEETASKSEVFMEAEDNIAPETIDIEPKKLSFGEELNILSRLNALYRQRSEYEKKFA